MSLSVSPTDLRRLRAAQEVLVNPLQYDEPAGWLQRASRHVQTIMGADRGYGFMPHNGRLVLSGTDLDPAFFEGLRASFEGIQKGQFLFDDPMPVNMHLQRRQGGAGVYHELALTDRETIEASPSYDTLFAPHGVKYALGLSVPLPAGEAVICLGFESPEAPGYDPEAASMLELLVPAFEVGIEQLRRFGPTQSILASITDALSDAILLVDADGRERYRNEAFRSLLQREPDAEALRQAAHALASPPAGTAIDPVRRTIALAGGTYSLRAGAAPPTLFGGPGTLVFVEPLSPYPPPSALEDTFDLTPREAEVALLLAEGLSNDGIAERLFISPHTARHHVQRVLRKLDCGSRAAVAHVLLQGPPPSS